MKKFFAAVLAVIMICMVMPVSVSALEFDDFYYTESGGEVTITGYKGGGGAINIPDEIATMPVVAIGNYAFQYDYIITGVTIPNTVTSIGTSAFSGTVIGNVSIPNSVTTIGDYAFYACSLRNITIPASVTNMGSGVVGSNYSSLETINLFKHSYADSYSFPAGTYTKNYIGAVIEYENLEGANNSQNPKTYTYGTDIISFNEISRPGYEFVRWEPSSISNVTSGDVVVTAVWQQISEEPEEPETPEEPEDTSTPPHLSQPSYDPSYNYSYPVPTPIYAPEALEIEVIAVLNKSGGVDSYKTRLEVLRAARTKGVTKITLILPEDCKGISTAAIGKCFKAANSVPLFLAYDDVTVRVTDKSRQVLTGVYYG